MTSPVANLLRRVRKDAKRRRGCVTARMMGRERTFRAWDAGEDTFVFEDGISSRLGEHSSVLIVAKADLVRGARGFLMTVSSGNHAVAAMPLLAGNFWDLARVPQSKRGKVLTDKILCANVVEGRIEISQREVPFPLLKRADDWLRTQGLDLDAVVFTERSDAALDHFRRLGQEWRVKPLAWTRSGMDAALAASRKRISSALRYYHSSRGVHFLSYAEFDKFAERARTDWPEFVQDLRELVGVPEGGALSYVRQPKYRGHHEVEFFGLPRGLGVERIAPRLERLVEKIVLGRISNEAAAADITDTGALYRSLLTRPALADPSSMDFVESLYMHLTGEIYVVAGEGSAPAFDDHRIALPGATYENGIPHFHPGIDDRSRVLLSSIRWLMNKEEKIEYANVYDLRGDAGDDTAEDARPCNPDSAAASRAPDDLTREIVYKTNRMPLPASLVEKRLAHHEKGYGSYLLARAEAFRALGVNLCEYRLLRRAGTPAQKPLYFYLRTRCPGTSAEDIPAAFFRKPGEFGGEDAGEDPRVALALAALMGDAAAQNLALKKYDSAAGDCRYGMGKEIYDFGYNLEAMRLMPQKVAFCSLRGTLGWPDLSRTEENLSAMFDFYISAYAKALFALRNKHPSVTLKDAGERFFDGFEYRSRAMEWNFASAREQFENFDPGLRPAFGFKRRWSFALWALERQVRRLATLRADFNAKLAALEANADSAAAHGAGEHRDLQ